MQTLKFLRTSVILACHSVVVATTTYLRPHPQAGCVWYGFEFSCPQAPSRKSKCQRLRPPRFELASLPDTLSRVLCALTAPYHRKQNRRCLRACRVRSESKILEGFSHWCGIVYYLRLEPQSFSSACLPVNKPKSLEGRWCDRRLQR
ncbi:hypothetical protein R3P38DRAFT_2878633 [Favolaschia claudopus]|uniref:Secreted protein n=1 Tax=Favolaschia claudopus TaxID=2862362 RepID=A0AAW0D055_9AGAR